MIKSIRSQNQRGITTSNFTSNSLIRKIIYIKTINNPSQRSNPHPVIVVDVGCFCEVLAVGLHTTDNNVGVQSHAVILN